MPLPEATPRLPVPHQHMDERVNAARRSIDAIIREAVETETVVGAVRTMRRVFAPEHALGYVAFDGAGDDEAAVASSAAAGDDIVPMDAASFGGLEFVSFPRESRLLVCVGWLLGRRGLRFFFADLTKLPWIETSSDLTSPPVRDPRSPFLCPFPQPMS